MRLLSHVVCFVLLIIAASAYAGEALVPSEISMDVTGKDAADAREQAMNKAESEALESLLMTLTTPEQVQRIMPTLASTQITAIVRGIEVLEEKITANRYRATLRVTFDGDEVSRLITNSAAPAGMQDFQQVGAFLVIPAYEEDGIQMLWEEGNPWRNAWKAAGLEVVSGDIVVPFGDTGDMTTVNAQTVASANYAALVPMTQRYGVSDIVILQAKFSKSPYMEFAVVKRRINRTLNEVNLLNYRADPQETKDMLLARAARDIAELIERRKAEEIETVQVVQGGEHNTVMALASISTLASWTQMRTKLSSLPMIDRLEVLAVSPQQVDLVIHYRGSPDSLAYAVTTLNIRLVKNENYWVISRD